MKRYIYFITLIFMTYTATAQIQYPDTKRVNQKDNYFGTNVEDPYRWLEDDNSQETREWVAAQNKVTNEYLSQIPFREKIRKELTSIWNYPKYGAPFRRGGYDYFYKNDGLQNQSVLYRRKTTGGTPEVFLDANTMSQDGTAAISALSFSKDYQYAAYLETQSGSDWQVAHIMEVSTKKVLHEKVDFIKFSGISWDDEDGFYYSRYPEPTEENKLTNQNVHHAVYYHKIGTPQSDDLLIYEDKKHPYRTINGRVSEDKRFLFIDKSEGTSGNELWVKDLKKPQSDFVNIIKGFDTESSFVGNDGDRLLVYTNDDAPNYKLVSIDPLHPEKSKWETPVPQKDIFLQNVSTAGGRLFLSYLKDASSQIFRADMKGKILNEIKLPGIGTASGFSARAQDKELFYTFSSFNMPATIFKLNISTGKSSLFRKSELKMNTDEMETEQVFFTSKDGTKVPMFLTYKKGLKRDGNNPVLLYGYGGFNIPITPGFSLSNAYFISKGGIYASVNLRGGNEYGEKWHKDGMLFNKQNVFDDMIAAAEYLIKENYTSKSRIAVRGGSNGGLLVGAVMTQRPDLFKVAIPQVGVMDMLRYHKFTIGWAWATEYGKSDDNIETFENLYSYSPLHNIKKGTSYPATLVTTADHDDRVVPAHSFKFAATLQANNEGLNPMLIRIDSKAGHGAGKPTSKIIDEAADIWSFVMYNIGTDSFDTSF